PWTWRLRALYVGLGLPLLEHRDLSGVIQIVLDGPVKLDVARRRLGVWALVELLLAQGGQRLAQLAVRAPQVFERGRPPRLVRRLDGRPVDVVRHLRDHL